MIYVVTEPVTPLAVHLAGLDLQGPPRSQYIAMGIYHCAKALSFLNNDCKLVSSSSVPHLGQRGLCNVYRAHLQPRRRPFPCLQLERS